MIGVLHSEPSPRHRHRRRTNIPSLPASPRPALFVKEIPNAPSIEEQGLVDLSAGVSAVTATPATDATAAAVEEDSDKAVAEEEVEEDTDKAVAEEEMEVGEDDDEWGTDSDGTDEVDQRMTRSRRRERRPPAPFPQQAGRAAPRRRPSPGPLPSREGIVEVEEEEDDDLWEEVINDDDDDADWGPNERTLSGAQATTTGPTAGGCGGSGRKQPHQPVAAGDVRLAHAVVAATTAGPANQPAAGGPEQPSMAGSDAGRGGAGRTSALKDPTGKLRKRRQRGKESAEKQPQQQVTRAYRALSATLSLPCETLSALTRELPTWTSFGRFTPTCVARWRR